METGYYENILCKYRADDLSFIEKIPIKSKDEYRWKYEDEDGESI